jgi:hypothetical protein
MDGDDIDFEGVEDYGTGDEPGSLLSMFFDGSEVMHDATMVVSESGADGTSTITLTPAGPTQGAPGAASSNSSRPSQPAAINGPRGGTGV